MKCNYCGQELPVGRRGRRYCNDAHKQAHYRQQHKSQATAEVSARIAELEDYNTRLKELLAIEQGRIVELEQQVLRLKTLLDVERRYYDNQPHNFRGWLRKQPRSDLITRLLARDTFPLKGRRADYEMQVRLLKGPASDLLEFADLWRGMLLSMP